MEMNGHCLGSLLISSIYYGQCRHAKQPAYSGPSRLYRMYDQGEGRGIILVHAKANQGGYHHEMPRTDTSLYGYRYGDATHRKGYQSYRYAQILGEPERKEGNVEIEEIPQPNQYGLEQE